jgi:hypothetical protein
VVDVVEPRLVVHEREALRSLLHAKAFAPGRGRQPSADPLGLEAGFNNRHYVPNPLHWLDPLGLLSCAQLLRNSMTAAGRAPGPGQAAAHVVASGGKLRQWAPADQARKLLAYYKVDINTAENGMRLNHPVPHNFTHRGPFHIRVRDNLSNLASSMSAAGHTKQQIGAALKQRLADIGQQVEAELATGSPAPGAFWTGP